MTMVTTVRLPTGLHAWAKKEARENGQTISGLLRVMLEQFRHQKDQAKRISKIKQLEA